MSLWILSFLTGILIIFTLYFAMDLANHKIRVGAIIALLLILVGETFDLLAEIVLNKLMLLFAETMEFFVVLGFFVMIYYIYNRKQKLSKKRKKKK